MDELGQWTIQVSSQGAGGPWTTISQPAAAARSYSDPVTRSPRCWYQIQQTTANGVSVPFNVAYVSTNPAGYLYFTYDSDNYTLTFVWSDPGPGDAVSGFVFDCRDTNLSDDPDNWESIDLYDADIRTATVAAYPGFTYRLRGIGI